MRPTLTSATLIIVGLTVILTPGFHTPIYLIWAVVIALHSYILVKEVQSVTRHP